MKKTLMQSMYCIKYSALYAGLSYISETGKRVGKKFGNHRQDVERNDKDASKQTSRSTL